MATASTALAVKDDVPCCAQPVHDRLKASTKAWLTATKVGFQTGYPSTDLYEVRLCPKCGSSMLRAVRIVSMRYVRMPRQAVARPRRVAAAGRGARQ